MSFLVKNLIYKMKTKNVTLNLISIKKAETISERLVTES